LALPPSPVPPVAGGTGGYVDELLGVDVSSFLISVTYNSRRIKDFIFHFNFPKIFISNLIYLMAEIER